MLAWNSSRSKPQSTPVICAPYLVRKLSGTLFGVGALDFRINPRLSKRMACFSILVAAPPRCVLLRPFNGRIQVNCSGRPHSARIAIELSGRHSYRRPGFCSQTPDRRPIACKEPPAASPRILWPVQSVCNVNHLVFGSRSFSRYLAASLVRPTSV